MEIRGIRESELEEMIDLQCTVFLPDGHERYSCYIREDQSYQPEQTRVIVVDGRIVATLRIWERQMRIGECIVRMGGIGGVGTHPDYRGAGYATAMLEDAIAYMQASGYDLSILFSIIPCGFYRRLGWACVPMEGVRITRQQTVGLGETDWNVMRFNEERDLEAVATLYNEYNAQQSGSIVRSRAYWDMGPSRIRGVLPTVVAQREGTLGGYLNFQIEGGQAHINELAYNRTDATALLALTNHFLHLCDEQDVEDICAEIPHRHPMVDLLVEGTTGDLALTGTTSMMVRAINLPVLLRQLLPQMQSRLNASNGQFAPVSIGFVVNEQQAVLRLADSGQLQVFNAAANAVPLTIPERFFWRTLLGESSWSRLEPTLKVCSTSSITQEVSSLLSVLFPQQEMVFWGPDHY